MKNKIVIAPSNKNAIRFLNLIKERKAKMQKHFSQPGILTTLQVDFDARMIEMRRDYRNKAHGSERAAADIIVG